MFDLVIGDLEQEIPPLASPTNSGQIVLRMAHDSADPGYHAVADRLAERVLAGFEPEAPFGYRYRHALARRALDRSGFLEGSAGIALALHTYASGSAPATSWDSALLLN
ncbi:glycoside hydrolase family protein [Streptomyces smyrnaeus]|uniref:hypothetical protein n=1 Tax=Streptomyces smyrnaeus TaxID=1387713 RepID=UPI003402F219